MEIYLIRHTTPKVGKGICYGQTDLEIDETLFEKELSQIQAVLPKNINKAYTSPLQRCTLLAQKLFSEYQSDERLMEMNFGDWENKNWQEIDQTKLNEWMRDFVNVKTPNGESYKDLHLRTEHFINELLKVNVEKIALITHAGNIRSFVSFVLSLSLENSFRVHLDYGAVVSVILDETVLNRKLISIFNFKGYE